LNPEPQTRNLKTRKNHHDHHRRTDQRQQKGDQGGHRGTKDADAIQKVATDQAAAGADYIDVNAGIFVGKEPEYLKWLVQTVQGRDRQPCAIDSPDPVSHRSGPVRTPGYAHDQLHFSLEKDRYEKLLPIINGTDMKVIALCMSDSGMPQTVDDRMKIADELVNGLMKNNVSVENIFVDPLVQPVSVNNTFGVEFINAIEQIVADLSGDSHGLRP
jgi:cobalamin-dependent methionine synthase I